MSCPNCQKETERKLKFEFVTCLNSIVMVPTFYYECECGEQYLDNVMVFYSRQHRSLAEEFTKKVNAQREN